MSGIKILKGNFIHTVKPEAFEVFDSSYMVIEDGIIQGIYNELPKSYSGIEIEDESNRLIIPPFCDIHLHAPQFNNVGLGMDKQLLEWLNTYTFPEESSFWNMEYADKVYRRLLNKLYEVGSLHFVAFGSIYKESTLHLMKLAEESGLQALIGKVNMDRNSPDFYIEKTEDSIKESIDFIEKSLDFKNVAPIVTPRFAPSCSKELMRELGNIAEKYDLYIQTHLNENRGEIAWVRELFPEYDNYLDVYDKLGLLRENKTVMAHCIWMSESEMECLNQKQGLVAHCPYSNANLASGIAGIDKMLKRGIKVGLASDISGGYELFMPKTLTMAIEYSKLYQCHIDEEAEVLSDSQCFYMATAQGEYVFPRTGSFKEGNKANYLVIDDSELLGENSKDTVSRLMRYLYIGDSDMIEKRVILGEELKKPF